MVQPTANSQQPIASSFVLVTWQDAQDKVLDVLGDAGTTILSIVLVILIALGVLRLLRMLVQRIVQRVLSTTQQAPRETQQKARTLATVVESAGQLIIILVAGMMILSSLGLEIGPLLASAGIAGLAIGLGAQSLIGDMINGFFILFENQYAVGDSIRVNQVSGTVEEIGLRRTVIRATNGAAIIIPNGEVRVVENLTKGWSRAVIDIDTLPAADDQQVIAILAELLGNIQEDPQIGAFILEPPEVLGITAITPTGVTYRVLVRTEPLQQWKVERELRRRILVAFKERDVPLPVLTTMYPRPEA
jgi:small conductance mechanosensitive channel